MRFKIGMLALALCAGRGSTAPGAEGVRTPGTAPAAGGYPILFERPAVVGNVSEIHDVYDMALTLTAVSPTHDPVEKKQTRHVDLTARMTIKGVNDKGQPTDVVLKVIRMVRADGRDMIRPGSVMRMTVGVENHVEECTTGPVPDAAMEMINRFFPPRGTSGKTMDDVFGSQTPRRGNESWNIDREAASEFFAGYGVTANEEEISGKTTVNGLRVDGLMVTTEIKLPNFTLPTILPKDGKLDLCSAKTVTTWILPVDPRAEVSEITATVDSMASGHGTVSMIGLEARAHEVIAIHSAVVQRAKPLVGQPAPGG